MRSELMGFLALGVVLAACGDDGMTTTDTGTSDTSVVDSSTDAPMDSGVDAADTAVADSRVPVPDGCVALPETCNGDDDDCDGFVDEGSADALTCGTGQECTDGMCVCPAGAMCGAECVDLASDRDNCGSCGTLCPAGQVCDGSSCCDPGVEPVDILFMVDNSNSMTEEQASLAAAFPQLIQALTTGDADGDGSPDFPAVTDLHVGVVTSDMGTGGNRVPTCPDPDFGGDGVLRTEGNTAISGCDATYPSFLSWTTGGDTRALSEDFGCVATVGTGGCGFEQQLEAVLKAVTPATSRTRFYSDTTGHADGMNAGFLRSSSVLAVVVVTDEEDCSAAMPELFDPSSTRYTSDLNLRCLSYPEALHPISRYVSGLLDTRSRTGDVVYTAITGVPVDLSGTDYARILSDPRMRETPSGSFIEPSCDTPGRGLAFPPRRIVQVAEELARRGSPTTVQSICQDDYVPAIRAIADRVGAVVGRTCD